MAKKRTVKRTDTTFDPQALTADQWAIVVMGLEGDLTICTFIGSVDGSGYVAMHEATIKNAKQRELLQLVRTLTKKEFQPDDLTRVRIVKNPQDIVSVLISCGSTLCIEYAPKGGAASQPVKEFPVRVSSIFRY